MRDSSTAVRPPLPEAASGSRRRWGLRNLRLRKRLTLLVLVPLIAVVALASGRVVSEASVIRSEDTLNAQAHIALDMAGLVYAVEDERDMVALYLTNGEQGSDLVTLNKAEAATQVQIASFDAAAQANDSALEDVARPVHKLMMQAIARLGDLPTLRQSVTSLGASRPIYQAYTTIIGDLLTFSGQLSTQTTDHTAASLISTLGLVEQAGEQSSQERGYEVGILGGGGELLAQQEDLVQSQAQYNGAVAQIGAQAPMTIANLYQADVGGDQTGRADSTVQQTIDAALQNFSVSFGVTDTDAYTEMTAKIAQIRSIETVVGQEILQRTAQLIGSAKDDLYLNLGIIVAVLLLAFGATALIARSITRPLLLLRSSALEIAETRLPAAIERLRDPAQAQERIGVEPIAIDSTDEIGSVARAFDEVHHAAVRLAGEQALLRTSVNAVFTNLSWRSQTLVERQLLLIDDLESGERDPARLSQLFRLDHLATRMRRNNENLLVLAGEETARRWTEAVRLVDVARAAAAEVEQYERIILGEMPRVGIVGGAAPDVAHLVAELLENATSYSAPQTKVWIAARPGDGGGVVLRIEDAGIGMKQADLDAANERINNPPVIDVSVARRMGLYVVGRLAARYGVTVRLGESQAGGVAAQIHLPDALLTQSAGDPLPTHSQLDDEFYALSRQLSQGANPVAQQIMDQSAASEAPGPFDGESAVPGAKGLFGDSRTSNVAAPMVPWPRGADWMEAGARFGLPEEEPAQDFWFLPSEDRKGNQAPAAPEGEVPRTDEPTSELPAVLPTAPFPVLPPPAPSAPVPPQASSAPATPVPPPTAPAMPVLPAMPAAAAEPAPATIYESFDRSALLPTHHARPTRPEPREAPLLEPTPIFEAIESEWFRRREQARAAAAASQQQHAGPDANADAGVDADAGHTAEQNTNTAVQNGPGPGPGQDQDPATRQANHPHQDSDTLERPENDPAAAAAPAEPARNWTSPGDDGWRAAQTLTSPAHNGQTHSGLPKRTPRANLVPGRAGGTGAAKAVPPNYFRRPPSGGAA